jgi:hypothetical protein
MAKKFNITGNCIEKRHYMADTTAKMQSILGLIENGEYFTINRPRQYGKTTTLMALAQVYATSEEYFIFSIGFSGVGDDVFVNEQSFVQMFIERLAAMTEYAHPDLAKWLYVESKLIQSLSGLPLFIKKLIAKIGKKIILLIDEVDKSSNNQLFLSFLGLLRDKYLNRDIPGEETFHSVILAGVNDIKTIKARLRPNENKSFNSPWNIATDFKVKMNLLPHEIVPMLEEYRRDKGVKMDAKVIAERLFYYTEGYPFLVSKLCKMLDEDELKGVDTKHWLEKDIELAAKLLVKESNANFDSLVKNLEDNPTLYELTQIVLYNEAPVPFNSHNMEVILGIAYGVFAMDGGESEKLQIHNRIYREVISNYMSFKMLIALGPNPKGATFQGRYVFGDNELDIAKILVAFQGFLGEEYSAKDDKFLERQGRLIFMAFIKPILNGGGFAFKEPQISEEKRLDLLVTFFQNRYILELKVWYGDVAHQKGLFQLADNLEKQKLDTGFLLIFDRTRKNTDRQEWITVQGKQIFAVWA